MAYNGGGQTKKSIGAFWIRKSKETGKSFLSGRVEVGGEEVDLIIFKNDYKTEEKHPDYKVFPAQPKEGDRPKPVRRPAEDDDEELPF